MDQRVTVAVEEFVENFVVAIAETKSRSGSSYRLMYFSIGLIQH